MNFNNILIGSEDPQRLADYYTRLFGKPTWDDSGYVGWLIGSGGVTVGPHDQVKGPNTQPGRIIWNIESPDVKGDFERLKAAGATVVREPYDFEHHPINKTANVVRVDSLDDAMKYVNVATQTVGFYPFGRMSDYHDRLASGGAQRIVRLGEAGPSTIGNPHDAMYPLHRLVHWMAHEDGVDLGR